VEHFCRDEYESLVEINFLKNVSLKKIFSGDLDAGTIKKNISLYLPESRIIPGKTCIFLDEIQECPEAITSLKFLAETDEFDVIASGSMLGIDYKRPTSYPVGAVQYIDMFSLNFREFLIAAGISDEILDDLKSCFINRTAVPWAIHDKIMELFRMYIVLGGMPEVLRLYFEEGSFADADRKIQTILTDYRYDIAHYAAADIKIKAEECYFSIPRQLSKENHKFMYSNVEKGGTARKFGSSIDWLKGACLVKSVCNTSGYDIPLESARIDDNFRLYPTDIGLLMGMFERAVKENIMHPGDGLLSGAVKGGIYEAVIADMLLKNGHKELYFRKTEDATFEIQFLLESSDGVIPIEVKAGRSKSKSLDSLLKREEIPYGYKLIDGNVGVADKKITLPLYMAMFM
jgi:predicted AAA+ superfamily ATPase